MIRLLKLAILAALAGVTAATGIFYATNATPEDVDRYQATTEAVAGKVWANVEANPWPVGLAVGTFLLTVVYHKACGRSVRQALEAAALRGTIVTPAAGQSQTESDVLTRAKNRTTKTQLTQDRFVLENRDRAMQVEISTAEKDSAWADREAEAAAEKAEGKRLAAITIHKKLTSLRTEREATAAELAKIDAELARLAPLV
jgi:hypothetical protein